MSLFVNEGPFGIQTAHACAGCAGGRSCREAMCGHRSLGDGWDPLNSLSPARAPEHSGTYLHYRVRPEELAGQVGLVVPLRICERCAVLADEFLQGQTLSRSDAVEVNIEATTAGRVLS